MSYTSSLAIGRYRKRVRPFLLHSPISQRQYFERVASQLAQDAVKKGRSTGTLQDALYQVTYEYIVKNSGSSILHQYGESAAYAVMCNFPEYHWKPWKFATPPRKWWIDLSLAYTRPKTSFERACATAVLSCILEEVAAENNIKTLDDWQERLQTGLEVDRRRFDRFGGLAQLLKELYPNHPWKTASDTYDASPFISTENLDFDHPKARWEFVQALSRNPDGNNLDNLYRIAASHFWKHGAARLLKMYGGAVHAIVSEIPDHAWKLWMFNRTEKGWWIKLRKLLAKGDPLVITLANELMRDVLLNTDMRNAFKEEVIARLGGLDFIIKNVPEVNKYSALIFAAESKPIKQKEASVVTETLSSLEEERKLLISHFSTEDNLNSAYNVRGADILAIGAQKLLSVYNKSPSQLLMTEIPDHAWIPWLFRVSGRQWLTMVLANFQFGDPAAEAALRYFAFDCAELVKGNARQARYLRNLLKRSKLHKLVPHAEGQIYSSGKANSCVTLDQAALQAIVMKLIPM